MSGYSVFRDTMADMTFPEIARAAQDGAVILWGLGVIEEHGPHLPLATDVYVPYAVLREAREQLFAAGVASVIAPMFYWGVNDVTAAFPGSFVVRAEVMIELMKDVFRSLRKDGFERVFCLSGHGDAAHNRALLEGVRAGRTYGPVASYLLVAPAMAARLGFDAGDEHLALLPDVPAEPSEYLNIHAEEWETSILWGAFPGVVREGIVPGLPPTNLDAADLIEWRKGGEHALRKTPDGYFGNPAGADPARGDAAVRAQAALVAQAVIAKTR